MRSSRLLAILILLQLRGRMSAAELAAEFEVSPRTILRDIDELSAAGVPVYAERGRAGGFQLHDGYQTRLTGFSGDEAQVLMLAGLGAAAADLGVGAEVAASQLKLAASLPPAQGAQARAAAERFLFDPSDWYRSRERPPALSTVAQALWQGRRLRLEYEGWREAAVRSVDPLGVVLKAGVWYLVAASRGRPATYRVSSVLGAEIEDQPCMRPKGFRLETYWRDRVTAFEASLLTGTARLRLSPRGARRLAELNAAAADALKAASPVEGVVEADIPIESLDQVMTLCLRLGADVEALAPQDLRRRLAEEGARLTRAYGA